ncbi:hypothetical protein [Streptomyces acidiscabies]|uniref:Uncharacterized protein n=1 Tax=Streptomyces acidiscabies TaxID=42234 RepID=A0ABU4MBX5_9ACTN|nr:hypothetical protein [Streptomyces acidiscabies]MDX3025413.1 hypothetical protein [Streptomyces acidiscabies]
MTTTLADATARLQALLDGLENGSWTPGPPESTCAAVVLTAPPRTLPADALVDGLRAAGPTVAPVGGQFAPALARCATLLRSSSFPLSEDGQQLRTLLDELLNAILEATPPPSWARRLL